MQIEKENIPLVIAILKRKSAAFKRRKARIDELLKSAIKEADDADRD
ncbi:MAG: hypothetical protein J0H84_02235 [Rhizobiales bacterium]|jgi:hypothetical protein|nr:hypothetical protein [Hyphomicrobiales bacterium]